MHKLVASAVVFVIAAIGTAQADSSHDLRAEMRAAAGGAAWVSTEALEWVGTDRSSGLDGTYKALIDRRSGRFREAARFSVGQSADGIDAAGPWHMDNSGGVHALDAAEARKVYTTYAWLFGRAWLSDDDRATWSAPTWVTEGGRAFEAVTVTPEGGRAVILRVDCATHLIERAELDLAIFHQTIRYADYRTFDGLVLPTTVTTDVGDPDDLDVVTVARWAPTHAPMDGTLTRPRTPDDWRMAGGQSSTTVPMLFEAGKLLVMASVNGAAPMPFILDTGGHAILTRDAAVRLGLAGIGQGVTYGAGEGSTAEQFARSDTLAIGAAEITGVPFEIAAEPYYFSERGSQQPIAGILGLEVFERFAVTLDHRARAVTLTPLPDFAPPASGVAVPIRFADDIPLVDGAINGRPGILAVDTGNSGDIVVQGRFARATGLDAAFKGGVGGVSSGQGGDSVYTIARLDGIDLGGVSLACPLARVAYDTAGAFSSRSEAGNVGEAALSLFKVTFDYGRQTMTLEHDPDAAPEPFPRAGLGARKLSAEAFTVGVLTPGGPADQAGLARGDRILSIDGVAASELAGSDFQNKIRQPVGTAVRLELEHDGVQRMVTVVLRDIIP